MSVVKNPKEHVCLICNDHQATGQWMGSKADIYVCEFCAVEVLPKLIADATLGRYTNDKFPGRGHQILETVSKNFWYATTCLGMRPPEERGV